MKITTADLNYLRKKKPIQKSEERIFVKPHFKPFAGNKTEMRYAQHLGFMKHGGAILAYVFQPFGMKLADKTYYHPDFLVVTPDCLEIHEVKARGKSGWSSMRDDANVKIKVASKLFPWFRFVLVHIDND